MIKHNNLMKSFALFSLVLGWTQMMSLVKGQDIGIGCGWAEGVESCSDADQQKIAAWRRLVAAKAGVPVDESVSWVNAAITRHQWAEAELEVGRGDALEHVVDEQCGNNNNQRALEENNSLHEQRRLGSCGCSRTLCRAGMACWCDCPGTRRRRNLSSLRSRRLTERELGSIKAFATRMCKQLSISCFDCDAPYVNDGGTVEAEPSGSWMNEEWARIDSEVAELEIEQEGGELEIEYENGEFEFEYENENGNENENENDR